MAVDSQTDRQTDRQLVSWSLTSLFSTNMAILETKKDRQTDGHNHNTFCVVYDSRKMYASSITQLVISIYPQIRKMKPASLGARWLREPWAGLSWTRMSNACRPWYNIHLASSQPTHHGGLVEPVAAQPVWNCISPASPSAWLNALFHSWLVAT